MSRRRDANREESPKVKISKESMQEAMVIFRYLKPYKGVFIVGLVFIALSSGSTMAFPYFLKSSSTALMECRTGHFHTAPAS
jgi:ABC-type multidrug transport system fused ATPase/permease subunit